MVIYLDNLIKKIIEILQVTVVYDNELTKNAYCFPNLNLIVINSCNPEWEQQKDLLHELGHLAKQRNNYKLYNLAYSLRSQMENEAEEFMIEKMLEAKLNDPDFEPSSFNYINFLESYEIETRYEPVVKEFMTKYLVGLKADNIFF
ncbi:ImmA/IrrE family metallo-endopeptidase [Enterococcus montenegrensis]|uniref:ImmA/IrrE family metallo-endopeptidase n=1 Tax=Enterococcus montenegrensis TaxID=3031993 RepID=UPI00249E97D1|nr:ImmA/IrrE family metallo-endopeptidase [Enterococcus montenegrensis]WHA08829.1 ImmA/IrrE family metallo-endopeptidase [Enterococcus montenegrensis]